MFNVQLSFDSWYELHLNIALGGTAVVIDNADQMSAGGSRAPG
jgi:hypothetical protein